MQKNSNNDLLINEIKTNSTKGIFDDRLFFNEPLNKHTTFGVGGPADIYAIVENIDELLILCNLAKKYKTEILIIGMGSNLLVSDKGFRGIIIRLSGEFNNIELTGADTVRVGGGVSLNKLISFARINKLSGMEFAVDIPGTVGGAVKTNAGAYEFAMSDFITNVTVLNSNNDIIEYVPEFGYRYSSIKDNEIILFVEFHFNKSSTKEINGKEKEIKQKRRSSQPKGRSAGCVFKNTYGLSAGKLLDETGCKKLCVGDAAVSEKHANFIINNGNASAEDIYTLVKKMKKNVFDKKKINLETEINIVGFDE